MNRAACELGCCGYGKRDSFVEFVYVVSAICLTMLTELLNRHSRSCREDVQ